MYCKYTCGYVRGQPEEVGSLLCARELNSSHQTQQSTLTSIGLISFFLYVVSHLFIWWVYICVVCEFVYVTMHACGDQRIASGVGSWLLLCRFGVLTQVIGHGRILSHLVAPRLPFVGMNNRLFPEFLSDEYITKTSPIELWWHMKAMKSWCRH